jgi:mRNA guanylyltransferase
MATLESPGEEVPDSKIREALKRRIQALFEESSPDGTFQKKNFPGSHPVSFSRDHLSGSTEYLVCEKSDGVRYLFYVPQIVNVRGVNECHCFLIDRKYSFWRITVLVPASILKADSLFDVELVMDYGTEIRILVYDTIFSNGICFMQNNYFDRLQAAWTDLIYPVRESKIRSKKGIEIYLKDFFRSSQIDYLWNHIKNLLPHKSDGLIFTSVSGEYLVGTNHNILKWKPGNLNTLDFSVKVSDNVYELYTQGKNLEKFGEMEKTEDESLKDGDIIECYLHENKWKMYKKRLDKSTPNSSDTANRVLKSIQDNISIEELIEFFSTTKKPKQS